MVVNIGELQASHNIGKLYSSFNSKIIWVTFLKFLCNFYIFPNKTVDTFVSITLYGPCVRSVIRERYSDAISVIYPIITSYC